MKSRRELLDLAMITFSCLNLNLGLTQYASVELVILFFLGCELRCVRLEQLLLKNWTGAT